MQKMRRGRGSLLWIGLFMIFILAAIIAGLAWIGGERPKSLIVVPIDNPAPLKTAPSV
jgi:hypothetical protein